MGGTWLAQGAVKANSSLAIRCYEAVPPKTQTDMNSFTDAMMNWEQSLDDIFEKDSEVELLKVAKKS